MTEAIQYRDSRDFAIESVVALYRANEWSSAEKPDLLHRALLGSHSLFTAWHGERLVGLGIDASLSLLFDPKRSPN